MKDLDIIINADNLWDSFYKSKKGVSWKEAIQRFEINLLLNILEIESSVRGKTYKPKKLFEFDLHERGRTRHIKAPHITDRVIQLSLDNNVLIPRIRPFLIYDNGASLTGKGVSFIRRRFEIHMRKAYKEFNGEGYVLFLDFKKYFDNIRHDVMIAQLSRFVDEETLEFIKRTVFNSFRIDVSYMSDEDFLNCMNIVFNALEYGAIPKTKTGEKFMDKSLGIGNPTSQICGVLHPFRIDNYCKIVKGLKYYGRGMDDTYIILKDKEELKKLYKEIKEICVKHGIFLNEKKTRIKKLTDWSTFLKINYKFVNGKLIRKICSESLRREQRRLKKYRQLVNKGDIPFIDVYNSYKSWVGTYKKFDSKYELLKLDNYFKELFKKELTEFG